MAHQPTAVGSFSNQSPLADQLHRDQVTARDLPIAPADGLAQVFRAVDGEVVPRASVSIEKNSRGTTWSVKYSHPDPDEAMRVALEMHLSMATHLGESAE